MTPEERAAALFGDMPWVTRLIPPPWIDDVREQIAACLGAAVAEEREACAKIALNLPDVGPEDPAQGGEIAAAIRARGQ